MASLGRGITNRQASYLAALSRELGQPYAGSGMSRLEASLAIRDAQEQLRRRSAMRQTARAGSQRPPAAG